jgi:hypothetical protein
MKSDWIVVTIPNDYASKFLVLNRSWGACYQWCMDAWGRNNEWVYQGPGNFHFKHQHDAAAFALRWS